jgi:hypothetical protein
MPRIIVLSLLACWIVPAAPPDSRFYKAAYRYADALLKHGRDHYGPRQTPLFVHMIDLRTLEIPKQRKAAEWREEMSHWKEDKNYLLWGKDRSNTDWAQDSNLLWDTENIRLLEALTKATGEERFHRAADEYMRYFLQHCVSPTTGLFAWGEHVAYNVVDDQVRGKRHELQHAAPLWEELWRIDPDAVRREIEGVYRYHITDKRTMAYDRHANFWNGAPERDQATILGYLGTFVSSFAFLKAKTGDANYDDWARRLLLAFQSKSNEQGLYPDNWTDRQMRELPLIFAPRPAVALGLIMAYDYTRDKRWLDDAGSYLLACAPELLRGPAENASVTVRWTFIDSALRAWRATGERRYLDLAVQVGEPIPATEPPRTQMASVEADRINALVALYRATSDKRWLAGARQAGDHALRIFVHPSGLIRGTAVIDRPDYYDAIHGPGALALALYWLGEEGAVE